MAAGSWTLAEELFAREDAGFVDELRRVHYADRLGAFAPVWFADPRPFARRALHDYLSRPLNCYRHEPLVKRLFKLAEKAGDDELMGAFLVAFDRSVRRVRKTITRFKHEQFASRAAAEAAARQWIAVGFTVPSITEWGNRVYANATRADEVVATPGNTAMPRPAEKHWKKNQPLDDGQRQRFERKHILFSLPTRRYLRRRAWRYFRRVGKADPARYVRAAGGFLARYTDGDADSDIHLLDNWGLMHALFRHSPAVVCPAKGWAFAEGKSIADLAPAPRYEAAWAADPQAVFGLMLAANCRAVRTWAVRMLRRHHDGWLAAQPVAALLKLADHADPDLSALGFDLLEQSADLSAVPVSEWIVRLDGDDLDKLQRLADLLVRRLDPARVPLDDAVRLAVHRSKPVAGLGVVLLKSRALGPDDADRLLRLCQAGCDALRPALAEWLRGTLAGFGPARSEWVMEFLDGKHADVRRVGWDWLNATPVRDDPTVWHKLIESPYDDVRGPLVAALAKRVAAGADPDAVRLLWATVLLNVARGGRHKPGTVARIAARAAAHPEEVDRLLPLLAVAVRSTRGPEFRAGLAGVVALAENEPELVPAIRQRFPELAL